MVFVKFACAGLLAAVVVQGTSSTSSDSGVRRLLQAPTSAPPSQPPVTAAPPSTTAAPAGTTAAPTEGSNFQGNFVNSGNSIVNNTSVDNSGATQSSYNGVVDSSINSNNTIGSNNVYVNYVNEVTSQVVSQYYSSSSTYNYNEIQQIVQQVVNEPGTQAVLPGTDVTISAQGSSGAISQVVATSNSGSSTTVGGSTTATSGSATSTDSSTYTSGNQTCSNYAACVFDPTLVAELDVLSLMVQLADCRSYASS